MRVLVVGLATTGASVVSYTRAAGHEVTVLDDAPGTSDAYAARVAGAEADGARVLERPDAADAAAQGRAADLVVPSPGVHPDHPALVAAHDAGVPVRSEIDLAAARLRARPDGPRLVAVTGTNGKTTVTTLIDAMLREAGIASAAAGNIGRPLLDAAGDDVDVVVAEVSSFQLAFTTDAFAPDVAVLLNVAEDHLDWHGSVDAYAQAKARALPTPDRDRAARRQPRRPRRACASPPTRPGRVVRFGTGLPGARRLRRRGVRAGRSARGPRRGAVVGRTARHAPTRWRRPRPRSRVGADLDAVARALDGFGGLAHRVQLVAERDGVRWYDDSKATNPHATAGALAGLRARGADRRRSQQGTRSRRAARPRARSCAGRRHRRGRRRGGGRVRGRGAGRARRLDARRGARGIDARTARRRRAPVACVRVVRLVRELRRAR